MPMLMPNNEAARRWRDKTAPLVRPATVEQEEKMKKALMIFGLLWLVFSAATPSCASELKVTNLSNIEIFPTIISGKSKESFGVVVIGKSKTVGFSPFMLGDKVEISWEEGESYDLTNVTIDSSNLKSIRKDVASIHLIYNGKRNWALKAFDKDHKEIGSIP